MGSKIKAHVLFVGNGRQGFLKAGELEVSVIMPQFAVIEKYRRRIFGMLSTP